MISGRSLYSLSILGVLVAVIVFLQYQDNPVEAAHSVPAAAVPAATFPADPASLGAIPDHTGTCQTAPFNAGRNVTFNVSGLSGNVATVEVSMAFGPSHTWMGDITAKLTAPNAASHVIFGRTLATTATGLGDDTDLGAGPYVFKDSAAAPPSGGWWQNATAQGAAVAMTAGDYRTTASGGAGATNPQPPTNMNASFTGVANANGTWTLNLVDGCNQDTGTISAASLTITTATVTPVDANADFNGDGRTDYTVARGTSTPLSEVIDSGLRPGRGNHSWMEERPGKTVPGTESAVPQAPPIYWYTLYNGSGLTSVQQLGDAATDFITPEDFDGDNKDDLVVWTEAASGSANFKVLKSSTNTVDVQIFGQTGDDPAVLGDYDGDNKADAAVFRCPALGAGDGQCYFFYRGSLNNPSGNITYVPWGFGEDGDFFPYVGDFDGDGKNDFCLQRANPASPTNGQFVLLKSNGLGVEYINWGLSSDFLIPGDYDGDGKTDLCVRRTVSGARQHWILTRTGSTSFHVWGVTGDSSVPGDYDGDGKTDLAIWRGSSTPGDSRFWVLNSNNSSVTTTTWGQCPTVNTCDFAVAGWAVH